jgi:hypothetical protein
VPEHTPNFNTTIPDKIMTPDKVSTRLGSLEFFDGMPTDATAATLLDHLTFLRGVEFLLELRPGGVAGSVAGRSGGDRRHGREPGRDVRRSAT